MRAPRYDEQLSRAKRAIELTKPLTFGDAISEVGDRPSKLIPYIGAAGEARELARIYRVSRAVEAGEQVDPAEMAYATEWVERQAKEKTPGYRWASILTELPAFAGEFLTSAGAASAGKQAVTHAGKRLIGPALRGAIEKSLARETLQTAGGKLGARLAALGLRGGVALGKGTGAAIGRTAQFGAADRLLGGGRISSSAYARALPGIGVSVDDAGELAVQTFGSSRSFLEALPEGILDTFIEVGSEQSGRALAKLTLLDRTRLAQRNLTAWYLKKHPRSGVSGLMKKLDQAGWQGPIEEYLEERAGSAARLATGLEDGGLADIFPGLEQSLVELSAFATPGVAIAGVDAASRTNVGRKVVQTIKDTSDAVTGRSDAPAPTSSSPPPSSEIAAPPAVSTASERERDLVALSRAVGFGVKARDAETDLQRRAVDIGRELELDVSLAAPETDADTLPVRGMSRTDGHVVIDFDTANPVGVVYHEAAHQMKRRAGEAKWKELLAGLDESVPGWRQDYEGLAAAEQARIGKPIEGETLEEEGVAWGVEALADYLEVLSTESGRADLARIAEAEPTTIQRIIDTVKDIYARLTGKTPESFAASYKRVQELLGTRPDQAAAETAVLLRDFMREASHNVAERTTEPRPPSRAKANAKAVTGFQEAAKAAAARGRKANRKPKKAKKPKKKAPVPAPEKGPAPTLAAPAAPAVAPKAPVAAPTQAKAAAKPKAKPPVAVPAEATTGAAATNLELAGGRSIPATYRVVSAADLVPSHDARRGFQKNEGGDLNERPYDDATEGRESRDTVRRIAEEPRPSLVFNTSPTAVDGPPIVRPGGVVLGGNARAMGVQLAYSRGGEAADAYRSAVQSFAPQVGISAAELEGVTDPVIVREIPEDQAGARGDLSRVLNDALTTSKTLATEAVSRGRKITPEVAREIAHITGDSSLAESWNSKGSVTRILAALRGAGALTDQEVAEIRRPDGLLTQAGKETVEQTLLGAIVPDVRTLAAAKPATRLKLLRGLPATIDALRRDPAIAKSLQLAVDATVEIAQNNESIDDALEQTTIEDRPWTHDETAVRLARGLDASTQKGWAARMRSVAAQLADRDSGQGALFGDGGAPAKDGAEAIQREFDQTENPPLFAAGPGLPWTRRLVAMHNLSQGNLEDAENLGGIPVPSIGVKDVDHGPISGFGDVTLFLSSDQVDPQKTGDPIYGTDIFSPRFPEVSYRKDSRELDRVIAELAPLYEPLGIPSWKLDMLLEGGRGHASEVFSRNPATWVVAAEATGEPIRRFQRTIRPSTQIFGTDSKAFRAFHRKYRGTRYPTEGSREHLEISAAVEAGMMELVGPGGIYFGIAEPRVDAWPELFDETGTLRLIKAHEALSDGTEQTKKTYKELNLDRMADAAKRRITLRDVQKWAAPFLDRIYPEAFIRVGRKKVALNLDSAVAAMRTNAPRAKENTLSFGPGNARAMAAEPMHSLDAVRENVDRLAPQEEVDAYMQGTSDPLGAEFRADVAEFYKWADPYSTIEAEERALRAIGRTMKAGKPNAARMKAALAREEFENVPSSVIETGVEYAQALVEMPAEYFEAKPQRAVKLEEFAGALVKRSAKESIALLKRHGVPVTTYRDTADRKAKLRTAIGNAERARKRAGEPVQILFGAGRTGLPSPSLVAGKRAADLADSPHFRRWFGDSVARDEAGAPRVFFHGTASTVANEFARDPSRTPAIFVTPHPGFASAFASLSGGGRARSDARKWPNSARLYPVFVRAENPFDFRDPAHVEALMAARQANALGTWGGVTKEAGLKRGLLEGKLEAIESKQVNEYLEALGFDSFYVQEGGVMNLGVLDPKQLKSAIANVGTYSVDEADIRYAAGDAAEVEAEETIKSRFGAGILAGWKDVKKNTKPRVLAALREAQLLLQDQELEIREIQDRIEESIGKPLEESADFYGAADLRRSKTPAQQQALTERLVQALEPFKGEKNALGEVSRLVALRTAADRNEWGRSTGRGQFISGITDMEAYVEFNRARRRLGPERVDRFLEFIRTENEASLQNLVDAGVLSSQTAEYFQKREPYYVSLRDLDEIDEEEINPFQKGRKGLPAQLFKKAEGRGELASDAMVAWLMDRFVRLDQAERNRALHAAEKLVPLYDEIEEGALEIVPGDASPEERPADRSVRYYVDGEAQYIVFPSPRLAKAIWGLNAQDTHAVFETIGKGTRAFSKLVTSRNPSFYLPNFLRDSSQALFTVAAEQGLPKGFDVYKRAWKMLPDMVAHAFGKETPLSDLYREAEVEGFKTTWATNNNAKEQTARLLAALLPGKGRAQWFRAVNDWLDNMSDAFESATRLAVYQAELEDGKTKRHAALSSKNVTVNFDKKGEATKWIGSLYAFFNPSVQGATRLVQAGLKDAHAKKVTATVALMGAMFEALGYAMSGDDELTGLPNYGMLSDYEKDRNMVFPVSIGGKYATIPLPYGLASVYSAGRRAIHLMAGDSIDPTYTRGRALMESLAQAATEFNPRGATSLWTNASPTLLQPFLELEINENFYGGKIQKGKSSFGRSLADSDRAFSTINDSPSGWLSQVAADALNLGGPEEVPTGLDVSPESIQHLLGAFILGGYGLRDLDRMGRFAMSKRQESALESTPFLRSFATEVTSFQTSALYYDLKHRIERVDSLTKALTGKARQDVVASDRQAYRLRERTKEIAKRLRKLNKQAKRSGTTREQRQRLRDQMTKAQASVVRAYYGSGG